MTFSHEVLSSDHCHVHVFDTVSYFEHLYEKVILTSITCAEKEDIEVCASFSFMLIDQGIN